MYAHRLARARHHAGDAFAHFHAHRANRVADRDARHELAVRFVEQVERRAIGVEQVGDLFENELEQLVEIERRTERHPHVAQGCRDPLFAGERGLELGDASRELLGCGLGLERHLR